VAHTVAEPTEDEEIVALYVPLPWSVTALTVPKLEVITMVPALTLRLLLFASLSCTVIVAVDELLAVAEPELVVIEVVVRLAELATIVTLVV
jgi:hypothetical protein